MNVGKIADYLPSYDSVRAGLHKIADCTRTAARVGLAALVLAAPGCGIDRQPDPFLGRRNDAVVYRHHFDLVETGKDYYVFEIRDGMHKGEKVRISRQELMHEYGTDSLEQEQSPSDRFVDRW